MAIEITEGLAKHVLEVVDAGLVAGLGDPVPGQMCVEAAICFALGEPHGDEPTCVAPSLRAFKIGLNDAAWSSPEVRARGMRRLALVQLGSVGVLDEAEFAKCLVMLTVNKVLPRMLRRIELEEHALACEAVTGLAAARAAARAAAGAAGAAARAAAEAAAVAAARAAAGAAAEAVGAATWAAGAAARAAAEAAGAATWAAGAAARAAAGAAAEAAAEAAADAAEDSELTIIAEEVTQLLITMNVPGCQWLHLAAA